MKVGFPKDSASAPLHTLTAYSFSFQMATGFRCQCRMSIQGSLQSGGSIGYMSTRFYRHRFVLGDPEVLQPKLNLWMHILILFENSVWPFSKLWTSSDLPWTSFSSGWKIASHSEAWLWWLRVLNLLGAAVGLRWFPQVGFGAPPLLGILVEAIAQKSY